MPKLKLTVIAPVFNEEQVIAHFHARTHAVLDTLDDVDAKILYVLDKCTDNTLEVLRNLANGDAKTRVIALSSRFGHQMSLLAGIENALDADAIVMMDSDLQHPPELIPELIGRYREGHDVVYTIRRDTEDAGLLRKAAGNLFYRVLRTLSKVPINANAADFRLISARVARCLASGFRERNMFLRGVFSWMGFKQSSVEYIAEKRFAGKSKYSFSRMMQLATAGILSFSTKPLQVGMFVGIGFAVLAFFFMLGAVVNYFIDQSLPSGWTTVVSLLLLFSGVQLIVLGTMGAYIGAIYEEVKGRPRYIIEEEIVHHEAVALHHRIGERAS
ncbi:MAG: glycosyl transferase, family 2 [Paucimonas sp.]|nr:glycosyl transferase, family 2 [Paucimonas sp.]